MHGTGKTIPGDLVYEEEPTGKTTLGDPLGVNSDEPMAVDEYGKFTQLVRD